MGFFQVSGKKTPLDSSDNRVIYHSLNGKEPQREGVCGEESDLETTGGATRCEHIIVNIRGQQDDSEVNCMQGYYNNFPMGLSEDTSGREAVQQL